MSAILVVQIMTVKVNCIRSSVNDWRSAILVVQLMTVKVNYISSSVNESEGQLY